MAGQTNTFDSGSAAAEEPDAISASAVFATPADADATLRALYDAHGAALLHYLLRHTQGDRHRAEDIVQETLFRAWQNIATLATDVRAVRAWLYTVARNLAIDQIRARQSRPTEVNDERLYDLVAVDDPTERLLNVKEVRAALATLPDRLREVLIEVHIRERPIVEVAESLGIPPGTVKSRTFYAMRAMRKALERRGFPFPPDSERTALPRPPVAPVG